MHPHALFEKVVIRDTKIEYRVIPVKEWVEKDDSLNGDGSY